ALCARSDTGSGLGWRFDQPPGTGAQHTLFQPISRVLQPIFSSLSSLSFASVLLRRELLEALGLLDEGFLMYFEDSDMCFRARAAGWGLTVAPDTAVLHKEGGSSSLDRRRRGSA